MAKFGFDVTEVEPSAPRGDYEPIPAGNYILKALEADEKKTASGGTMITAKFEVVKGEHAGRLLWQNFNTVNNSPTAQSIGRGQIVAWAHACGKPNADDTDKLLGKPFAASVDIDPAKNGYKASNKIKAFLAQQDDGEAPAKKAPAAPKTAPKAAPAAKGANPWD
jgi:hypothetical protein